MVQITDRQQRLIQQLIESTEPVKGDALAASIGVSLRTVQGEVRELNRKVPGLIVSTNRGYVLKRDVYAGIIDALAFEQGYDLQNEIVRKLLFADTPINIDELADMVYASTPSLTKAIKDLNEELAPKGLRIVRERNLISLSGSERDKRRLIRSLISEEADQAFTSLENLENYFDDIDVQRIDSITANAIFRNGHSTDDPYYGNLLMNIVIALYRMKSAHYLPEDYEEADLGPDELAIAHDICENYAEHWNLEPTDADVAYIAMLLTGQIRKDGSGVDVPQDVIGQEFLDKLCSILDECFAAFQLKVDYMPNLYGLALHVFSMVKRARSGQPAENVLLPSLKVDAPFVYDVAVMIAMRLSEEYGIVVADDEIGFICVHIGFMVQESMHDANKVQVAVCDTAYHQIGTRLKAKLEASTPDLVEVYPINPAMAYQLNDPKTDLIVSTKPIPGNPKVVVISPFFTNGDAMTMNGRIMQVLEQKRFERLKELSRSSFSEEFFIRTADALDRDEAIGLLAGKLMDAGIVPETFERQVLQREELSSTCFFDTFAIPHSTEMNAEHTMCCVLLSEKGVDWDGHLIHLVIMIAVCREDRKVFMELYTDIVEALENPEKVMKAIRSKTTDEFLMNLM